MCMLVLRIIGPQVVRLLLLGLCSDAPSPPLPSSDFFLGEGRLYTGYCFWAVKI